MRLRTEFGQPRPALARQKGRKLLSWRKTLRLLKWVNPYYALRSMNEAA